MIRTASVIIWTVVATVVLGLLTIITSFFTKNGNACHRIAGFWGRSILWIGRVQVDVKGLANIDEQQSYLFMVNHQSLFDIPVVLGHLPHQFRWLAKAELFRIPIFGYAMRRVGYISIDRSNRKEAFKSLQEAAQKMSSGVSVLIFPEGTRSKDGRILPFKKGGFVLAVDSGVPVVPMIIHGTREIMEKHTFRIRPGRVVLDILPSIDSSDYTRKTKDELLDKVHDIFVSERDKGKGEGE